MHRRRASSQSISLSSAATSIAFDNNENLWIATTGSVASYAPPYNGAPNPSLSVGHPAAIDFDYYNNLYVADSSAGTVTQFLQSSSYAAGLSVGSLDQPSSLSAGIYVNVCTIATATTYYFGSSVNLNGAIATGGSTPCLVAGDYTQVGTWVATAFSSTATELQGTHAYSYLSYKTAAIAAFPGPRI